MNLEHVLRRSLKRARVQRVDLLLARAVKTLVRELDLPVQTAAAGAGLEVARARAVLEDPRIKVLGIQRTRWLCERMVELGADRGPTAEIVRQAIASLPRVVRPARPRTTGRAA